MSVPSLPSGYDTSKPVNAGRSDCHITVGFDQERQHIPRFLVQLQYQVSKNPIRWEEIARMDHNETNPRGHNVYQEGLHVDVSRRGGSTVHLELRHGPLATNRGMIIRRCVEYLRDEAEYFIDVYEGRISPGGPPRWPDGGEPPQAYCEVGMYLGQSTMGQAHSADDEVLSPEELSEILGEATGTNAEDIERGAEDIEIAPPEEAAVVED